MTFDSGEFCVRLSILLLVYHKSLIRKTFLVNYLIVLIHIPTKTVLLNLKLKVINYIYLPQSKIISCNEISQFIISLCKGVLNPITVKPVLTATSEQWPPANNGQPKPSQIKFNGNFD